MPMPARAVILVISVLIFASTLPGQVCDENSKRETAMETSAIEKMRVQYEADILVVDGVVSVAIGLNAEGKPCLQIGTSLPPEKVRPKLPAAIFSVDVEVIYMGTLEAQ